LLDGKPGANMGGIYENFVAQELKAHGFDLRYFSKHKIGELDFVIEDEDGRMLAMEVKSGGNYMTHAALSNAMKVSGYEIDEAYVLAETNVVQGGDVLYLPIYMVSIFAFGESG
ncbi:MAG: DUF4143 domain-containing protein, partial [Clostridiales Family XIII bacterium]|jgi:predicted AAA+ superfamily ATPase|nr:DUF4143 domain-containing protein [Clostridiales Family XIII bacterium]